MRTRMKKIGKKERCNGLTKAKQIRIPSVSWTARNYQTNELQSDSTIGWSSRFDNSSRELLKYQIATFIWDTLVRIKSFYMNIFPFISYINGSNLFCFLFYLLFSLHLFVRKLCVIISLLFYYTAFLIIFSKFLRLLQFFSIFLILRLLTI